MDAFRSIATTEGKTKLSQIPAMVESHHAYFLANFNESPDVVLKTLTDAAGDLKAGKCNPLVKNLLATVGGQLCADIDALKAVARWVSMAVPVVEDGNNFGCDVQAHVLKIVQDTAKKLEANVESLAAYSKDRGEAISKVVPSASRKTSNSESTTNTVGGKEEDAGDKTSTTKSSSSESSESDVVEDTLDHVIMIDLKWYNKLKGMCVDMMDSLAFCGDIMHKNLEKIENPRGEGSSGFSMY